MRRRNLRSEWQRGLRVVLCLALILPVYLPKPVRGTSRPPQFSSQGFSIQGPPRPNMKRIDQLRNNNQKLGPPPPPKPSKRCGFRDVACKQEVEMQPQTEAAMAYPGYDHRLADPRNRVGEVEDDLFTGNYTWSETLLDLPGRAGLDLKLDLVYNSLVWTRSVDAITFDLAYYAGLTPGFRLGLPRSPT